MIKNFGYLLLLISTCVCGTIKSQSDFDLSQRWFNESVYNPGATGNSFSTGIFVHSRVQWLNTEGAPMTNAVSADTYVDYLKSGFGLSVLTDKIGYVNSWSAKLSYAYYIPLSQKSSLALGLSGYLQNRSSNITPDMLEQANDPALSYSRVNEYNPDFDFGLEYLGPVKFGAAVRHLLNFQPVNSQILPHSMNVWAYLSSRFNLSDGVSLEPAASYMFRDNIHRIEGGAIFYFLKTKNANKYNDRFWFGGMYRLNKQFSALAGASLTSRLKLGYSFDYGIGDLAYISKMGTHEIFLSWHFNKLFYKDTTCPAYRKRIRN